MTYDPNYDPNSIDVEALSEPDGIIRMQALEFALDFVKGRGPSSLDADDAVLIASKFYDFITGED